MAIAYFTTWTTYGTWLPGDVRGWYEPGVGIRGPDTLKEVEALLRMSGDALILSNAERKVVEDTVARHCAIRRWLLHAVNCRTNHVHVVVTAPKVDLDVPRKQFKTWCTRKLNEHFLTISTHLQRRDDWWTERGWDEYIDDEEHLYNAIRYVKELQ